MIGQIQAPSLVDEAHRQIRTLILTGELRPGEPLRDSLLADQMGVSRSPVREALRLLEKSGLVAKTMNRSYRVSALAAEDIPELAALRVADEVLAARTIVHNGYPIDELEAQLELLRASQGDLAQAAVADAGFHVKLVELARLPRLSARYAELRDQIQLVLVAGDLDKFMMTDALVHEHETLIEGFRHAIAAGDATDFVRMLEEHILGGMKTPGIHARL